MYKFIFEYTPRIRHDNHLTHFTFVKTFLCVVGHRCLQSSQTLIGQLGVSTDNQVYKTFTMIY